MWDGMGTTRRSVSRRHRRVLWDRRNWQDLARGIRSAGRLPLLAGILVAGMVVGRGMVGTMDGALGEQAAALAGGFLAHRSGQTALETFLASFFSSGAQLLLLFFLGFCAIGTPLLYLYPFVRGLGMGFGYGTLFYQHGWLALGWFCLLLPNLLISTVVLLQACQQSIDLSLKFWTFTGRREGPMARITPSPVYSRFVFFLLLLLLSAGVDCGLFALFGRFLAL